MNGEILSAVWPEWTIVRRINSGSYGVVYEAIRTDHGVESRAAIKVISIPQDENEIETLRSVGVFDNESKTYFRELVDEFVNEIRIMESFKGSQNIVSVEDYKVVAKNDQEGWDIYIRMELLTPLTTYISDKKLSEYEVIRLGCDICCALERCAKRNVIHRDIKPDNIFINEFGDYKLGDFGVARKLENATSGLSQKGTLNYMAPEIVKGEHYDATVDIYSLGMVLYWLTNKKRLPFLNPEQQLISPHAINSAYQKRIGGEPLPAPCDASETLSQVILTACDPDPGKRFATAGAMKNALMSVVAANGNTKNNVVQNGVSRIGTFGEKKKSKIPVILAAVLLLLLASGGGLYFAGANRKIVDSEEKNNVLVVSEEASEDEQPVTEEAEQVPAESAVIEEKKDDEKGEIDQQPGAVQQEKRSIDDVFPPEGSFFTYDGHTYCFYDVYAIDENEYGNVIDTSEGAYKNVQQFCRDQGGHLAIINSEEENDALFAETQGKYDHTVFFGLSDRNKEGRWVWDDGTEDTLGLWAVKYGVQQPDNGNGFSYENYAEFDYDRNNPSGSDNTGKWNDAVYLENTSIFICEWDCILEGLELQETQTQQSDGDTYGGYFTEQQIEEIRASLHVPDDSGIEIVVGEPYYWDGGDMDLVDVDFYEDGEFIAGAACRPYSTETIRSIYMYSKQ